MGNSKSPILAKCRSFALTVFVAGICATAARQAGAQDAKPQATADSSAGAQSRTSAENPRVSPGSPRAAVTQFLTLSRAGRFDAAADYLEIPDAASADRLVLARQLRSVLDRHLMRDVSELSPLTIGDTADGLPLAIEQIGRIALPNGEQAPVRLVRLRADSGVAWRFSASTVAHVQEWYATLPDRWALDHLPPTLLRSGPFEILWWQWLAIPILLAAAITASWLISKPVLALASRIVARTRSTWDDAVIVGVHLPLTVALSLAAFAAALPLIDLYETAAATVLRAIRAGYFIVFFWTLWRLTNVGHLVLSASRWASASSSSRALVPLASRVVKVLLLAIAVVGFLSMLGYPVASLLAGLGLGGLALALAAQKTVENLFGAFSIGIDQPFREGDFVKIEDFVGTVETLGLRATRFRTLDRTLISVPNGRLAEMRLESFSARDRMRLATVIGLVYETTAKQMREVLTGFERVLRSHPKIWPAAVTVKFQQFGASSLDIEIMAWFEVPEWSDFQAIRQEILLQFMEVVERAGSAFAFPTQTVHLASVPESVENRPARSDGNRTQ